MEDKSMINYKFIIFVKATLGKMVATNTLEPDFINLDFWDSWPRKFYNIRAYDMTKEEFHDEFYVKKTSIPCSTADGENVQEVNSTQVDNTPKVFYKLLNFIIVLLITVKGSVA